jgi:hypothetical protein
MAVLTMLVSIADKNVADMAATTTSRRLVVELSVLVAMSITATPNAGVTSTRAACAMLETARWLAVL